jgi:predicted permease
MLAWWRRLRHRDEDLELEIRGHLEAEIDERMQAGQGETKARQAALRAFGNRLRAAEETRAVWGWPAAEAVWQDLRYGVRLLGRAPVFTLFALASLALGIGGATAIFTLFNAIVLRSLPVSEPERLVTLSFAAEPGQPNSYLPYPQFARMHDGNRTMDALFATAGPSRMAVTISGQAALAMGTYVSGDYYAALGLQPALGRLLSPGDDHPGQAVAVISYAYWQSHFGGSPATAGSGISINQIPFTIVGIEPRGFHGTQAGSTSDIVIPMRARDELSSGEPLWDQATNSWIQVMGRLGPGVSRAQAEQDLDRLFREVNLEAARTVPVSYRAEAERGAREGKLLVEAGSGGMISFLRLDYEKWLRLLLGLLGAVMLIAGLNVATLLLSRSEARQKEILTRLALGARRGRLVRQLLTESALLAGIGGVLGLALGWWGSTALVPLALPAAEASPFDLTPDARVAGFTIAAGALLCLLFGLLPALRATGARHFPSSGREVGVRRRRVLDRTLVAAQIATSFVLVAFAALFVRTLTNLRTQDTGYDRNNILMFSVDAGLAARKGDAARSLYRRLLDELQTLPGALSVTASSVRPIDNDAYFAGIVTRIGSHEYTERQAIGVAHNHVAPGYFATLGVPLLAGRDFGPRDDIHTPKVAIISETMARERFGGENPVGQVIRMNEEAREVVGIARDLRYGNLKDSPRDVVYRPLFQTMEKDFEFTPNFEIRYAGSESSMRRLVQAAIARVTPELAPFRMKTLLLETEESIARERLLATLTTYFSVFTLLLAGVGLFGLMSYVVVRRTPELGLRMALGAAPASVRRLVLRESTVIVIAGVSLGIAGAIAAVRLIRAQLFGIELSDPALFAAVAALLLSLGLAAAYLPAFRASRINPVSALRAD